MKKLVSLALLFTFVLAISACTKKQEAPVEETETTEEVVVEETK